MGYVYFIENSKAKSVKIGYSKNHPSRRLKQLQTGSSEQLELIYFVRGTFDTEYFMHKRFENSKIKGEWYKSEIVKHWIRVEKLREQYINNGEVS